MMEEWKRAWINKPSVDPEERLPDVWEAFTRTAFAMWNNSSSSAWNMKNRPMATVIRFHDVGIDAAVTWGIYLRLDPDPLQWSQWAQTRGAFHRDGFLDLIRKRVAVVQPGHQPRGPELAALAHSLVFAVASQIETLYSITAGRVPQYVRDFLGVDQELEI